MAMNPRNPIQLLRGKSSSIDSVVGKEGSLYYDTNLGILAIDNGDSFHHHIRVFGDVINSPSIYVDSNSGDDNNSGFDIDNPVKSLDRALWLCNIRSSIHEPIIYLAGGDYSTSCVNFPNCNIQGSGIGVCNLFLSNIETRSRYARIYDCNVNFTNTAADIAMIASYGSYYTFERCAIYVNAATVQRFAYSGDGGYLLFEDCVYKSNNTFTNNIMYAGNNGYIYIQSMDITGNITNESGYQTVYANSGYVKVGSFTTSTGSVTGRRYYATQGGYISVSGQGANAIPGTEEGYVSASGYYF